MQRRLVRRAPSLLLTISVLLLSLSALPVRAAAPPPTPWVGAWATGSYAGTPGAPTPLLIGSTLRQIVHTSIAGRALRIRVSNQFGADPLTIGAVTIALSAGNSAIQPGSLHPVTFSGKTSFVIPPGAIALSDTVNLATPALADLAISLYLPIQQISIPTFHRNGLQTNYVQLGNEVSATTLSAPQTITSWYFLQAVDVQPTVDHAAAIVAFGDSITDGSHSSISQNRRWPDILAARLHANPATASLAVLNEGIGGNRILRDGTGPSALARFDTDVLAQPGVRYVIVLEGINDIGRLARPNDPEDHVTAEDLEWGLSQLIDRAHLHGLKIFGATLTPYAGADYYTAQGEQVREALNTWIRTSGRFDGVIDFDKATADSANPLAFRPGFAFTDHLHPVDAGYAAMANAINLSLFR